jgi:tight adherence protein B
MAILITVFFCVLLLGLGLGLYAHRRTRLSLRKHAAGERLTSPQPTRANSPVSLRRDIARGAPADSGRLARELSRLTLQAGVVIAPIALLTTAALLFACGVALALLRLTLVPALGCGVALASAPFLYLRMKRSRRLKTISQQLPYVLDMLRSALQTGHNLGRGLQMASDNSPDPLAAELRMIVDHVRVGMRLPLAFELMYRRVPVEELSFLAAAVSVQEDTGSSLGEIIGRVTQSIRNRQRLHDQIKTLTSQSRLSAIIVSALPAVILVAFYLVRPDYVRVLFTNPPGIKILEGAIILDVLAFFLMRRIARVDF